ncbi:NADH:flavin oxidoreductase/NADH oxidase [Tumebacillus flagellatus]|uniref:NADPH dehydrogenase n=1 Tax=Tumebacillus flagellatus TaxID=1157490 RepID=A0A074MHA1_9BACL|nr:NADH:flavin oxidoreductase/NADH oxidase [Tumebacillus flagellatus]KEO85062.1 NADPH dehydrogenase [Tumebacillus flagellatus]
MTQLSDPFVLKGLELKNRIVMPPMCQYSVTAKDGIPNEWHYVHYVSRAVGGTGLVIIEMTDVEPDGRITDHDLGLWSDEHVPAFARIIREVQSYGAKVAIQIAHAGRKAEDAPQPVGPTDVAFSDRYQKPRALTTEEVRGMVQKFQDAARRAVEAGVDTIELHGAHGYLIHQFLSPAINTRSDEYGQDRAKFGVEVIQAVKSVMPESMPLIIRVSATEYMEGGYDLDYAIEFCRRFQEAGVDIFHISSGGEGPVAPNRRPGNHAGYQVPLAHGIKQALGVPVIAVGNLDDHAVAQATLGNGHADLVAVGRGMLRDPYWATHALRELEKQNIAPKQYKRAY